MSRTLTAITLSLLVAACSAQEEAKTTVPTPDPAPIPAPEPAPSSASASIASVELLQDCPDPQPATPAAPAESAPASMAPADSAYPAPCLQSSMQIAFAAQSASSKVKLREVRLLTPSGETLDTIKLRLPSMWKDNGYVPWDEMLAPNIELKASYKLTPPDWTSVESKLGGTSYGAMFLLEVELDIGGETKVLRSSEFARQRPEMVPT